MSNDAPPTEEIRIRRGEVQRAAIHDAADEIDLSRLHRASPDGPQRRAHRRPRDRPDL